MLYMSCERVLQMRLLGDGALRDALELRRVKLAIGRKTSKKIPKKIPTFSSPYVDHCTSVLASTLGTVYSPHEVLLRDEVLLMDVIVDFA